MRIRATVINISAAILAAVILYGCAGPVYPENKPYAYKTKVIIEGDYSDAEKKDLQRKLENQLDDSLVTGQARKKLLGIPYNVKVYHSYDTNNIARTREFFNAAYVANGYFRGGQTTDTTIIEQGNPFRRTIIFTARPNKNHRIKSVTYEIADSALLQLTLQKKDESLLADTVLYSQNLLNAERERLAAIYRNNGYLKMNKEDLRIVADTINPWLIIPTSDPIELAQNLQNADTFNKRPTTGIRIILADTTDKTKLRRYYVGNIFIQPDNMDNDITPPGTDSFNHIIKQYFENKFKNKVFRNKVALKKGDLYRQENYAKTINTFNFMGPWQQVILQPVFDTIRKTDTVDFKMLMRPYPKYQGERKLEGTINSYNSENNLQLGNLLGISASQIVKNRNFGHEAIQSSFSARAGIELRFDKTTKIVNTFQGGLGYSLLFPEFKSLYRGRFKSATAQRTFLSFNTSYTHRLDYFSLLDVSASYGAQFVGPKNWNHQVTFPNIERKFLRRSDSLDSQIVRLPILAFTFNSGLIAGFKYNGTKIITARNKNITGSARLAAELSLPAPTGVKEFRNNLFTFFKIEYDHRIYVARKKSASSWAFRFFSGIGLPDYMNQKLPQNQHLPFFKQFTAGGPNSMRAWGIRTLSSYSTRTGANDEVDFFGDIQAEINAEWRYDYFKIRGIPIRGALFADIGNIWNWKPYNKTIIPAGISAMDKIYHDIGIAGGTSLRVDFDYFLVRLDFGVKIKDPLAAAKNQNGGWFDKSNFNFSDEGFRVIKMQLGINYPF